MNDSIKPRLKQKYLYISSQWDDFPQFSIPSSSFVRLVDDSSSVDTISMQLESTFIALLSKLHSYMLPICRKPIFNVD